MKVEEPGPSICDVNNFVLSLMQFTHVAHLSSTPTSPEGTVLPDTASAVQPRLCNCGKKKKKRKQLKNFYSIWWVLVGFWTVWAVFWSGRKSLSFHGGAENCLLWATLKLYQQLNSESFIPHFSPPSVTLQHQSETLCKVWHLGQKDIHSLPLWQFKQQHCFFKKT